MPRQSFPKTLMSHKVQGKKKQSQEDKKISSVLEKRRKQIAKLMQQKTRMQNRELYRIGVNASKRRSYIEDENKTCADIKSLQMEIQELKERLQWAESTRQVHEGPLIFKKRPDIHERSLCGISGLANEIWHKFG